MSHHRPDGLSMTTPQSNHDAPIVAAWAEIIRIVPTMTKPIPAHSTVATRREVSRSRAQSMITLADPRPRARPR